MQVHIIVTRDFARYSDANYVSVKHAYFDYDQAKAMKVFLLKNRQHDEVNIETRDVKARQTLI